MDPNYLGLFGVAIGGLITLIVSYMAFRKELTILREQFKTQRTEKIEMLKMEKYANFLGAYYYIEGSIGDIVDLLETKKEDYAECLSKIAYEPAFENAIITINNGKGWVLLLSKETGIKSNILEIEKLYDEIQTTISKVRNGSLSADEALISIQGNQAILKEISKNISELMRNDVIGSFQ